MRRDCRVLLGGEPLLLGKLCKVGFVFLRYMTTAPLRRATLFQLSYGCVGGSFSRLVGLGNGLQGLKGIRSKAPKARVTRSNRVGRARKAHMPSVPGLWRLDFIIYTAEDGSFRPPGITGVQMNHVVR
jgi:hypothetical protein